MKNLMSLLKVALKVFFTRRDSAFGVIPVFEKGDERLYLLICSRKGYWGFPKGHAFILEPPLQTAKRELEEETGILNCDVISDFPIDQSYTFKHFGLKIYKTTRLYIGKVTNSEVVIDNKEIVEFKWVDFQQALKIVSLEYGGKALKEAEQYLNRKY